MYACDPSYWCLISIEKLRPTIWLLDSHQRGYATVATVRTAAVETWKLFEMVYLYIIHMAVYMFFTVEGVGQPNWTSFVEIGGPRAFALQKPIHTTETDPWKSRATGSPVGLLPHSPLRIRNGYDRVELGPTLQFGPLWFGAFPRRQIVGGFPPIWLVVQVQPTDIFHRRIFETIFGNGKVPKLNIDFSLEHTYPNFRFPIFNRDITRNFGVRAIPVLPHCMLRQGNLFPTTHGGKAFDTGLLMEWLQDDMEAGSQAVCWLKLDKAGPYPHGLHFSSSLSSSHWMVD